MTAVQGSISQSMKIRNFIRKYLPKYAKNVDKFRHFTDETINSDQMANVACSHDIIKPTFSSKFSRYFPQKSYARTYYI